MGHNISIAVEGTLEDGLLSLDEKNALARYTGYFSLDQHDLDQNGVQTSLVQAAVLRDVTQGIIPKRQLVNGAVPFNLMKSEQLVWVTQGVDYLETVVRRERRGSSHASASGSPGACTTGPAPPQPAHRVGGVSPRRHRDAGSHDQAHLLRRQAVTGPVRPDSRFDPFSDGFGIMRDAQTAKPQTFRTGDGRFAYNLAMNLAQM